MDRQKEGLLFAFLRGVDIASQHPFATCTVFGAVVGSAATYSIMNLLSEEQKSGIFTPKVYKLELPQADMQRLMLDPTAELRWETPNVVVIVSMEKPEPLKQLPYIDAEPA